LAEPPALSPSTMNGEPGARGGDRLVDDLARVVRILLQVLGELRVDGRLDEACDLGVAELRLRLALELRVLELHGDDRGEPLAHVLALQVVLLLLQEALIARVLVQCARERRAEAGRVRAALDRVDVVGEREDGFLIRRVPLHRDLDVAGVGLALEVRDVSVYGILRLVDVRDEVLDAALVVELDRVAAVGALVGQADPQPARQERGLPEALAERLGGELGLLEDLRVG
jgi:hypothetical protein